MPHLAPAFHFVGGVRLGNGVVHALANPLTGLGCADAGRGFVEGRVVCSERVTSVVDDDAARESAIGFVVAFALGPPRGLPGFEGSGRRGMQSSVPKGVAR